MIVSIVSHGIGCLAFAAFAALLALGGNRRGAALYLIIACLVTAAWSASAGLAAYSGTAREAPELVLETTRGAAWMLFLYRMLLEAALRRGAPPPKRIILPGVLFFVSIIVADTLMGEGFLDRALLAQYDMVGRLIIPIIGLSLIENIARDDWQGAQWWARFLFIGLGSIFAYDIFLYSEALLFRRVDLDLYAVRGAVNAIAVPFMAIALARNPTLSIDIHVSRQFIFHTMTLALTGVYLLLMAVAGYYLRNFGGNWGTLLQATFLSVALVMVFLTISSGTVRSAIRNFISRHFFSYKYDYRHEWLQFIGLIAAQESLLPLHDRVIQAIGNIVDSPGGTLWVRRDGESEMVNTAAWNLPLDREPHLLPPELIEWLESGHSLELNGATGPSADSSTAAPALPKWIAAMVRAWIAIPLIHRHRLVGIVTLTTPRAPRSLSGEDFELLGTVGRQAASYIAEEEGARALLDARQLELFNQRFAFVVHDIKNIVSQLSLILTNAERHGNNPDFQRDVLTTVGHSVARMKSLLEQLSIARRSEPDLATFDLAGALEREWPNAASRDPRLRVLLPADPCMVRGNEETVLQVVRHIVQNAIEAIAEHGTVEVAVQAGLGKATLRIADDGPGMTAEFIRDELFRPFRSTKRSGYGIGAYQARELIRGMGGRLEVVSAPGSGTRFTIQLPLTPATLQAAVCEVQQA